jgi:predicted enzyme involved in methoxymalonyl-ACP biosynthesis
MSKTNQLNTTGKRWTSEELQAAMSSRVKLYAFEVDDKHTGYGLLGVPVVHEWEIIRYVLSWSVVGLDVVLAALVKLIELMRQHAAAPTTAGSVNTDANLLCPGLFPSIGFVQHPGGCRLDGAVPGIPEHIDVTVI